MQNTLKEFILVCGAVILANLIIAVTKRLIAPKSAPPPTTFRFTSPIDAISYDLGRVLWNIRKLLDKDWKTCAFPVKIDIGDHGGKTWAKNDQLVPFVSAMLEKEGWVVTRDVTCKPEEIILDIPKKSF